MSKVPDRTPGFTPLYDPAVDGESFVAPVDMALRQARKVLAEKAAANIHDHDAMIRAAVGLEMRLRELVAALDAEAGR